MNHIFVVGAGLLGGIIGFAVSAIIAIRMAIARGVSSREGAHGYLGMVAGIGGGLIVLVLSMILALRLQGVTNLGSLIAGTLGGGLTIFGLAAFAFGIYWLSVPKLLNRDGASPQLYFEIIRGLYSAYERTGQPLGLDCVCGHCHRSDLADRGHYSFNDGGTNVNYRFGNVSWLWRGRRIRFSAWRYVWCSCRHVAP